MAASSYACIVPLSTSRLSNGRDDRPVLLPAVARAEKTPAHKHQDNGDGQPMARGRRQTGGWNATLVLGGYGNLWEGMGFHMRAKRAYLHRHT